MEKFWMVMDVATGEFLAGDDELVARPPTDNVAVAKAKEWMAQDKRGHVVLLEAVAEVKAEIAYGVAKI